MYFEAINVFQRDTWYAIYIENPRVLKNAPDFGLQLIHILMHEWDF